MCGITVIETFASTVTRVLSTFQLLDNHDCQSQLFFESETFQSYTKHRMKQVPTIGSPFFTLQQIAWHIHQHRDHRDPDLTTVDSCAQKLCLSLQKWTPKELRTISRRVDSGTGKEYERELLAAAICTNTLSIIRNCYVRDKYGQFQTRTGYGGSFFFGSYEELAGKHGNTELIEFLITGNGSTVNTRMRASIFGYAAKADRLEMVQFIQNFRRDEVPWCFQNRAVPTILYQALHTSSVEILKFVGKLCADTNTETQEIWNIGTRMTNSARTGLVDMVLHLLSVLTRYKEYHDLFGLDARGPEPVKAAAFNGHVAVVDILLEAGADPAGAILSASSRGHKEVVQKLLDKGISPSGALTKAAGGGYLETAITLLNAGADVNETIGAESPLASAIALEHTNLFSLLLERGGNLQSTGTAAECVRRAKEDGLESMLLILKERGIKVEE